MKEIIQEREGLRLELVKTHQLVEQYKASSTAAIKVTEAEKDSKMPTFIEEKPAVKTRETTAHMLKQSETSPPAKDNYEEEVSFASSQRNRWSHHLSSQKNKASPKTMRQLQFIGSHLTSVFREPAHRNSLSYSNEPYAASS